MVLCERISEIGYWDRLEEASIETVIAGGMAAMGYYREAASSFTRSIERKTDPVLERLLNDFTSQNKNPPTAADLEATSAILRTADSLLVPIAADLICGLSYLGEESIRETHRNWLERVLGTNIARRIHEPGYFFSADTNVLRIILDGLDGTANFNRGIPLFCSAAAILVDHQPRVGAMYDPIHNEVYSAVLPGPFDQPEKGAWAFVWEIAAGKRIDLALLGQKRETLPLVWEAAAIHLTRSDPKKLAEFLDELKNLAEACNSIYALNAGIPAMALVARSSLGAYINNHTNLWDAAAGEVLVRASGGMVTRFDGQNLSYDSNRRVSVVAAKAHLHAALLQILQANSQLSVEPERAEIR